jgi:hypothetical protein
MGPSDQRFYQLREFWQEAPTDLSDRILIEFNIKHSGGAFDDKESFEFSRIIDIEILPPFYVTNNIQKKFAVSASSGRIKKKFARVLLLSSLSAALYIFYISEKKPISTDSKQYTATPIISSVNEFTDSVQTPDSVRKPINRKPSFVPIKNITINAVPATLFESDILYSYIMYKLSEQNPVDDSGYDFISIDEFSIIRISPYTARLIRLSMQQNRQGELKRRAKRILRKLEGLREKERQQFSDLRISNPLNPVDLASFIDGDKK